MKTTDDVSTVAAPCLFSIVEQLIGGGEAGNENSGYTVSISPMKVWRTPRVKEYRSRPDCGELERKQVWSQIEPIVAQWSQEKNLPIYLAQYGTKEPDVLECHQLYPQFPGL